MQDINSQGHLRADQGGPAHLEVADNPHILTLSPPLNLQPRWLGA